MSQSYLNKAKYNVAELLNSYIGNNISIQKKKHKKYTIIKYDKSKCLPSDYYKVGFLRTMIIDRDANKIVCVGPNKSIPVEEIQQYSENNINYEEFVDGVMMNVFWDGENNNWEYATRSNVGADIRFYLQNGPNMTFKTMFQEALAEDEIDLNVLPKNYCYNFVLQHPKNRVVAPVDKPHVVLVEAHTIDECIVTIYPHGKGEGDRVLRQIIDKNNISIPEKYNYTCLSEARERHATRNTHFGCVGVVLKNYETGWRSKLRNPVYEEVKMLRGNSPKHQFLYLTLRHSGNLAKYLQYFPEERARFDGYRKQVHRFTHNLYVNYVDCFINKKAKICAFPGQYKGCMASLHTLYLDQLMPNRNHVHKGIVIQFFNDMPPQQQMYLLNYHHRIQ